MLIEKSEISCEHCDSDNVSLIHHNSFIVCFECNDCGKIFTITKNVD